MVSLSYGDNYFSINMQVKIAIDCGSIVRENMQEGLEDENSSARS